MLESTATPLQAAAPGNRHELIVGGQKSGKSRRAELLARDWLAADPAHRAALIATGQPWDEEMRQRIARHQADRAVRVPGLATLEEPLDLAGTVARHSTPQTLLIVDCLTLWLTNVLMPYQPAAEIHEAADSTLADVPSQLAALSSQAQPGQGAAPAVAALVQALHAAPGPVILVGNEIGLGVIPMGREVREFVDALGGLNQSVAAACATVTLMVAGLPLTLKVPAAR